MPIHSRRALSPFGILAGLVLIVVGIAGILMGVFLFGLIALPQFFVTGFTIDVLSVILIGLGLWVAWKF